MFNFNILLFNGKALLPTWCMQYACIVNENMDELFNIKINKNSSIFA